MSDTHAQHRRLTALYETARAVSSSLDFAVVTRRLAEEGCAALEACAVAIYVTDARGLRLAVSAGDAACVRFAPLLDQREAMALVGTAQAALVAAEQWPAALAAPGPARAALLVVPLIPPAGSLNGVVCAALSAEAAERAHADESESLLFARALADQGAVAMQHALAHEALQRAEKQRAQFVRVVTHELRSPVVGAQSMLRAVMSSSAYEFTATQRDIMTRLSRRMDSLLDLINDLLSLAATRADDHQQPLEPIYLQPIVQDAVEYFRFQADEKKHRLQLQMPPLAIRVLGTKEGMERILENLIGNAVKYTPERGQISVELRRETDQVILKVRDTGIGIPPEDVEKLGQEFFRASNAKAAGVSGTGLGLTMVQLILQRFGGTLHVESTVSVGTTITAALPLAERSAL